MAVADVSYYVQLGSALDQAAYLRGNSIYFPTRVIPMLPALLSSDLCSLKPQVERLCMLCQMRITKTGKVSDYRFYPAVMRSHARMTYAKVAKILQQDQRLCTQYASIVPHLENLHHLYKALAAARRQRGALDFVSSS